MSPHTLLTKLIFFSHYIHPNYILISSILAVHTSFLSSYLHSFSQLAAGFEKVIVSDIRLKFCLLTGY